MAQFTATVVSGSIVRYNNELYLFLGLNKSGFARLLKTDGGIYSGTPSPHKLTLVKTLECYRHIPTGNVYCNTKLGYISLTTGRIMSDNFVEHQIHNELLSDKVPPRMQGYITMELFENEFIDLVKMYFDSGKYFNTIDPDGIDDLNFKYIDGRKLAFIPA